MARTPLSTGRWLRLVWLAAWATSLVAVIAGVVVVTVTSREITAAAVSLVLGTSAVLYVVVESMGVAPRRPPPPRPPVDALLRGKQRHDETSTRGKL